MDAAASAGPELPTGAQDLSESDEEYDMGCPTSVKKMMRHSFAPKDVAKCGATRADVAKVVDFCVEHYRSQATRAKPLAHLIRLEVVGPKVLATPAKRETWYTSWANKRSERFHRGSLGVKKKPPNT